MTFLEAALDILKREGRPLHFKELTERAMTKKLLTFVGRTPEVTMQTQLTAAVKKAPGSPFVRVKPGVFGLLRYPELTAEEKERDKKEAAAAAAPAEGRAPRRDRGDSASAESGDGEESGGRRRRRRGGRTRGGKARPDGQGDAQDEVKASSKSGGKAGGPAEGERGDAVAAPDLHDDGSDDAPEPGAGSGLSAAARAAALAETGVLEGDREDTGHDDDGEDAEDGDDADLDLAEGGAAGPAEEEAGRLTATSSAEAGDAAESAAAEDDDGLEGDDDDGEGGPPATNAAGLPTAEGDELGRRRRRRRRRRRGGGDDDGARLDPNRAPSSGGDSPGTGSADRFASDGGRSASEPGSPIGAGGGGEAAGEGNFAPAASNGDTAGSGDPQQARKITTPVDAAIEILKSQPPGRGVHVRQLADSAIRRRLIHGEPNEAWRVIRTALAAEPKERLRSGQRPRVRAAGSGLYALARRPPDAELEKAEQVFGEARRALRERTMAALERRLAELSPGAFEAIARVLLQREGFGPTTFVKRVEGTIYVEALRGRGMRPAKCLIALRPGATPAGRRAIGELRAGIRARNHDEGLLMLGGRLSDEAIAEWKQSGPPLEIADGPALAETCARHGVGVLTASVNVDFVDADFFSELVEG